MQDSYGVYLFSESVPRYDLISILIPWRACSQ